MIGKCFEFSTASRIKFFELAMIFIVKCFEFLLVRRLFAIGGLGFDCQVLRISMGRESMVLLVKGSDWLVLRVSMVPE